MALVVVQANRASQVSVAAAIHRFICCCYTFAFFRPCLQLLQIDTICSAIVHSNNAVAYLPEFDSLVIRRNDVFRVA